MQLHIGYSKIFSTCFHCINIFIISRHRNETQVGQVRQKHNSSIFMTFYSITQSSNHPTLVTMSKPMHFNGMIFTQLEPPEPKVQQPSNLDLSLCHDSNTPNAPVFSPSSLYDHARKSWTPKNTSNLHKTYTGSDVTMPFTQEVAATYAHLP